MGDHICTSESLVAGGLVLPACECVWCLKQSKAKAGYGGCYCPKCKQLWTGEEFMGDFAKWRREEMGLTRPQIAKMFKKSKHTIKAYEFVKCPIEYAEFIKDLYLKYVLEIQGEQDG